MTRRFIHATVLGAIAVFCLSFPANELFGQSQPNDPGLVHLPSNRLFESGLDFAPFSDDDPEYSPWKVDWPISISHLRGMPSEYAVASINYVSAAVDLLDSVGTTPAFQFHQPEPNPIKGRTTPRTEGVYFPFVLKTSVVYESTVELIILPEPDLVRTLMPAGVQLIDGDFPRSDLEGEFWGTLYFSITSRDLRQIPFEHYLSTPRGYKRCEQFSGSAFLHRGKAVGVYPTSMFNHLSHVSPEVNILGLIGVFAIAESNSKLWYVHFRSGANQYKNWIAYTVIDSGGLLTTHSDGGLTFTRIVDAPYNPRIMHSDGGETEHSQLLIPTHERHPHLVSEQWTLCDEHYSENEVPIWCLWMQPQSTPWQERFTLAHVDSPPTSGTLRKVIVFPNCSPSAIVNALVKLKCVPKQQLPDFHKVETTLVPLFRKLRAVKKVYVESCAIDWKASGSR